jgi:hypothetical protein
MVVRQSFNVENLITAVEKVLCDRLLKRMMEGER